MSKPHKKRKQIFAFLLVLTTIIQTMAQEKQEFLSAKKSEPSNFSLMEGFPPPADKVLHSWDRSFFLFPAIRYSLVHMRDFLPTTRVSRGLKAASAMIYALDGKIDELTFTPWNTTEKLTWEQS